MAAVVVVSYVAAVVLQVGYAGHQTPTPRRGGLCPCPGSLQQAGGDGHGQSRIGQFTTLSTDCFVIVHTCEEFKCKCLLIYMALYLYSDILLCCTIYKSI